MNPTRAQLDAAETYYTGIWRRNVAISRKLNLRDRMHAERAAAATAIRAIRAQREDVSALRWALRQMERAEERIRQQRDEIDGLKAKLDEAKP